MKLHPAWHIARSQCSWTSSCPGTRLLTCTVVRPGSVCSQKRSRKKDFMVIALCQLSQPVEVVSSGGLLTTLFMKTMSSVCLPSIFCYACQPVFSMSSQLSLVMYRYWRACSASGSQYGRPLRAVGFPCPRSPSGFLLTVIFGVCSWKGGFGK